mgnify:CR=1 FL=1
MPRGILLSPNFWDNVNVGAPDACWDWKYATIRAGYGYRWRRGGEGDRYTHREAYRLTHGEIPDGMFVCHSCDRPICCNPAHLFLGTPADNVHDMVRKQRHAYGERAATATLTEEQVREIRQRWARGEQAQCLASEYGVVQMTIYTVVRRKSWRHLPNETPQITRPRRSSAAKVTIDQVREIRRIYAAGGITYRTLGRRYGITDSAVCRIVKGSNRKEVA